MSDGRIPATVISLLTMSFMRREKNLIFMWNNPF